MGKGLITFPVTLKCGASVGTLTKLVDIKDYPDMGAAPEALETTTMSDPAETYVNSIMSNSAKEFTTNYHPDYFDAVADKANTHQLYSLEFGENGEYGKFYWWGEHSVPWLVGAGVKTVPDMRFSVAPASAVLKDEVPDDPKNVTPSSVTTLNTSDPAVITAIDNGNETLTVADATTVEDLLAVVKSTDGSNQTYAVTDSGEEGKTGALVTGDLLHVTAEDGTQATYTITVSS